jgi:hypothetical protein
MRDPDRFILAIGDGIPRVLERSDVRVVRRRPTFVLAKASRALAQQLWRDGARWISVLDGEDAAKAAVGLLEHVPDRIAD